MEQKAVNMMKKWVKEEDGFQVFEKFGLTQGGVLLALGVAAVSVVVMNDFWGGVGERYFAGDAGIDNLNPGTAAQTQWDMPQSQPWN